MWNPNPPTRTKSPNTAIFRPSVTPESTGAGVKRTSSHGQKSHREYPTTSTNPHSLTVILLIFWVFSLTSIEIILNHLPGSPLMTWKSLFVMAAGLSLLITSWQLLWISMAMLATVGHLPLRSRQWLAASAQRLGGVAAERVLRAGASTLVATSAVALTGSGAFAATPSADVDLLWPDSQVNTELLDAPPNGDSPEKPEYSEPGIPGTNSSSNLDADAPLLPSSEGTDHQPLQKALDEAPPAPPEEATPPRSKGAAPQRTDTVPVVSGIPGPFTSSMATAPESHSLPSAADEQLTTVKGTVLGGPSVAADIAIAAGTMSAIHNPFSPLNLSSGQESARVDSPPQMTPAEPGASTTYRVKEGDSLWSIATDMSSTCGADALSPTVIDRRWREIHAGNHQIIGANPDLIIPGMELEITPPQCR